jgi:hypothetical protein
MFNKLYQHTRETQKKEKTMIRTKTKQYFRVHNIMVATIVAFTATAQVRGGTIYPKYDSPAGSPTTNNISNLAVGPVDGSNNYFRTYLTFDLTSAEMVEDVKLTLTHGNYGEGNTSSLAQIFTLFGVASDWNGVAAHGPEGTALATQNITPAIGDDKQSVSFRSEALTAAFNAAVGGTLYLGIKSDAESASAGIRSFMFFGSVEDAGREPKFTYSDIPMAGADVLVTEDFVDALAGSDADFFNSALVSAGGDATWGASSIFKANGEVAGDGNRCAFLKLGSYINDYKGEDDGVFALTMTISEVTGSADADLISLGFSGEASAPSTVGDFVSETGLATVAYRRSKALDMWAGVNAANGVAGSTGNTGSKTLRIVLDLTTTGGYDGITNFGTVYWSNDTDGVDLGSSFTYTWDNAFNWILISSRSAASGTISELSLTGPTPPAGTLMIIN